MYRFTKTYENIIWLFKTCDPQISPFIIDYLKHQNLIKGCF